MRLILQRSACSGVRINGAEQLKAGRGLVIFAGFSERDDRKTADFMASKAVNLRIFSENGGGMNLSLLDIGGECLVIPNFTLYADCKKGRRPSFTNAAPPDTARPLYDYFVEALRRAGVSRVVNGQFGADMLVEIQNDGPVTIFLDSDEIM